MSLNAFFAVMMGLTLFNLFLLLSYMFVVSTQGEKEVDESKSPDIEEMKKHIIWKSFYVNPNDPRAWVPKTWGYGQTLNFRTKGQALTFALLIVMTLVPAVIAGTLAFKLL